MPVIISSSSVPEALLSVDSTSKAARAAVYDSRGNKLDTIPMLPQFGGEYVTRFEHRNTALFSFVQGASAFVFQGPNSKLKANIRRIYGNMTFDGTGLSASGIMKYGLYRGYNTAVSFSGSVPSTTSNKDGTTSQYAANTASYPINSSDTTNWSSNQPRFDPDPLHIVALPAISTQVAVVANSGSQGGNWQFNIGFGTIDDNWAGDDLFEGDQDSGLVVGTHELLVMRMVAGAISGVGMYGYIEWDER